MSEYMLKNDDVTVTVNEFASEIHSFKDNLNGIEYMWQGDAKYWSGRNPTLFPVVGSTWDKKLHINGKEYTIGNHGFVRHSMFTCVKHDKEHLVMRLTGNSETEKQYPYAFTMNITYTLNKRTLKIHYEIINDSNSRLPFSFGLHPAFNCPIDPDKEFSDYHIETNQPETIELNSGEKKISTIIPLNRDSLRKTMIITNPKSTEVSLTDGRHSVTVHFRGYEWLAFWSPDAPFVCIEPWHGHDDFMRINVPFEKREGTILLASEHTWETDYAIKID
jgi:Galactose mutarotase and related enzymes